MKRLRIVALMLFVIFMSNGLQSQSTADTKTDDKSETEQSQTQPVKTYDLTPVYLKDMKWKETYKIVSKREYADRIETQTMELTANVSVVDVKDKKPTKVKYDKLKGKEIEEDKYDAGTFVDEDEIEEISFTAYIDEDYRIKSVSNDIDVFDVIEYLLLYPTGNLSGFIPPKSTVKVGDTWKSDKLIAANLHLYQKMEDFILTISNNTSVFKLESVEEKDKLEIATITWKGDCSIEIIAVVNSSFNLKWDVSIKYDLTNKRLLSTEALVLGAHAYILKKNVIRTLEYEKLETKEKELELKPKNDEDE